MAPKGNNFWELRSKHGRDLLFASPELLREAAVEYFEWCTKHPLIEIDFRGSLLKRIRIPKMRAFTMHGLCSYIDCNTNYFRTFKAQQPSNEGFNMVILWIEETVYNQKFTGAAAGFLNANIISRDLGLADKVDAKITAPISVILNPSPGCEPLKDDE